MEKVRQKTNRSSNAGFTLIELMVVVALIAIITSIATPSLKRFMLAAQVRTAVNDWTLAVQTARSEAVRQRTSVTVCPSSNGSTCTATASYEVGWILKMGTSATTGTAGRLLQDFLPLTSLTMTANKNAAFLTYLANGVPIGSFTGIRIVVQENATDPDDSLTRYICVARTGRAKVYNEVQYLALPAGNCG